MNLQRNSNSSAVAVVEEKNRWTFAELQIEVNCIATLLKEKVKGDTVGVLLLNSEKYVATVLAIWKAGKTAVPLNYLLPPADLGYIVKDSGMSALVSSQFFSQALAALKPLFGENGTILLADDPDFLSAPAAEKSEYRDPALYLYTSGTTGRPKGVILTHDNLIANVESCKRAGEFDHRDGFLCLLPFFHTYAITGTLLLPLLNGSKMVLVDRFQPAESAELDPGTQDQRISGNSIDVSGARLQ